jgi:hypothetical protein
VLRQLRQDTRFGATGISKTVRQLRDAPLVRRGRAAGSAGLDADRDVVEEALVKAGIGGLDEHALSLRPFDVSIP